MSTPTPRDVPSTGRKVPPTTFVDHKERTLTTGDVLAGARGLPVLFAFFKVNCPTCQLSWPY
ncbi:MAG TPA: hypothetical protein VLH41_00315, partial [Thermoanaerobaculia bacterium]|nr:hypothetical protein [Thermoanaerobaculia bacterium]